MRQKYRKAGVVCNVVIHIHGDVGQLITGDVSVDSIRVNQNMKGNVGMVAGRDIINESLGEAIARFVAGKLDEV